MAAIQAANEAHWRNRQLAIQQQQESVAAQRARAEIGEAAARAGYYGSEAQKNQIQIDNMRDAQKTFAPQPAQPQQPTAQPGAPAAAPAQPAPESQSLPAASGAVGSASPAIVPGQGPTQPAPAQAWLPANTPTQLAPMVAAMLPKDLTDQEKNVIEGGAQTGRMEALQAGNFSQYLNSIRQGVDSVVNNRNLASRNPENQLLTGNDRSNFLKNVIPSFENLSPAQVKGAQAELLGAKSQRDLNQLEARLSNQDNQALQRKIAQQNILANKEIAHNQSLDLAGRRDITTATGKWGDAFGQVQVALTTIDAAKNGDDLATRMVPTMEVLGINMTGGIKRISPTEADAARMPVSWMNRFNQWVDSRTQGKTSPEMVSEGKQLMHDLVDVKYGQYLAEQKSIVLNYSIDPKSVYVMNNEGESVTLDKALKNAPTQAKQVPAGPQIPAGARSVSKDGKVIGYTTDGKTMTPLGGEQ